MRVFTFDEGFFFLFCGLFISGALLVYWARVLLNIVYFLFLFFSTLFTTYELNQGGRDGWIEEAIEVETRMFECGRHRRNRSGC